MPRTILHVDMDAFYAAIEARDHPELRGQPLVVGSDPKGGKGRGIVATASYEARRFGIHSAQPISTAYRLCPHARFVRPDMERYAEVSASVIRILHGFTDLVEQVSIDEAFLDAGGSRRLFGDGAAVARAIKARVRGELELTASVGVAANKFVAKVASDLEKPDGLVVVTPGEERAFLAPLPIRRLWGVGARTEEALATAGIRRIGQLAEIPAADLERWLGATGEHLGRLARGLDDRPVVAEGSNRSIGHETTFDPDTEDRGQIEATLLALVEKLTRRLRQHGVAARTIAVKFRRADFSTCTRRVTLPEPADTSEQVAPVALGLFGALFGEGTLVRLVGVYGTNLVAPGARQQLELFAPAARPRRELAAAVDAITRRFGEQAITRARLVGKRQR